MMTFNQLRSRRRMLLAVVYASSITFFWAAVTPAQQGRASAEAPGDAASPAFAPPVATDQPPSISRTVSSGRAAMMYRRLWGIDNITLRATASGSVIRFSYLVVDADKAKILNDKKEEPYLLVQKTGARLEVPATEKVGKLRQTATPENGRQYWMVFQNSSHMVQPGDRVDIVIGSFRASGLVVEPSQTEAVAKP